MLMISTRVSVVGTDQKDRQKEATHASITTYCDKWDFAGIRANQNVSIRKLKMGTFFNTYKIYFFKTLNLAFKMAFLHGSLN